MLILPGRADFLKQTVLEFGKQAFQTLSRVSFCKGGEAPKISYLNPLLGEKNKTSSLVLPSEEDQDSQRLKQFKHKVHWDVKGWCQGYLAQLGEWD